MYFPSLSVSAPLYKVKGGGGARLVFHYKYYANGFAFPLLNCTWLLTLVRARKPETDLMYLKDP